MIVDKGVHVSLEVTLFPGARSHVVEVQYGAEGRGCPWLFPKYFIPGVLST